MCGAIPSLSQYDFMAWCSVKGTGTTLPYFTLPYYYVAHHNKATLEMVIICTGNHIDTKLWALGPFFFFFFWAGATRTSTSILGLKQPPVQSVKGAVSLAVKRMERKSDH
jgi:hypothetical protein